MPKKLRKSLNIYLSKLKKLPSNLSLPSTPSSNSLLSACKYPKTPSFTRHRRPRPMGPTTSANAATLSDVDRFLQENFHSLYLHDDDADAAATMDHHVIKPSSDRFFVSPGRNSSSLLTSSSASSSSELSPVVPRDGVAVTTLSKDPYDDFRQSMQEMVDARHVEPGQPLDWDFMEELLFCYLELNDRCVHKYILKAFSDLTAGFRRRGSAGKKERRRMSRRGRECRDLEMMSKGSGGGGGGGQWEEVKECCHDDHS